jgi:dUTP pyrophosphatase
MTWRSAGADVRCSEDTSIPPGKVVMVPTGCFVEMEMLDTLCVNSIPYLALHLRSSLCKRGLMLANGVGVIDLDYTKEIKVALFNTTNYGIKIPQGERIAQLIQMVSCRLYGDVNVEEGMVRVGGFGSTGTGILAEGNESCDNTEVKSGG